MIWCGVNKSHGHLWQPRMRPLCLLLASTPTDPILQFSRLTKKSSSHHCSFALQIAPLRYTIYQYEGGYSKQMSTTLFIEDNILHAKSVTCWLWCYVHESHDLSLSNFKQKYWESHKKLYLLYIAVAAVQYPSLILENTLCRILLNFWQNWWKQFDIQSLQLLKLSNLFNLLHLLQFRLLTQSPLVEDPVNPNLNLFVIREAIWYQIGWTAFGGRLQQSDVELKNIPTRVETRFQNPILDQLVCYWPAKGRTVQRNFSLVRNLNYNILT